MLNLSSSDNQENRNFSELSDRPFKPTSAKINLPRHMSSLASSQHNRHQNLRSAETREFSTTEQFNPDQVGMSVSAPDLTPAGATNLAVNILRYQLKDTIARQKHLKNVQNNLERRLATAQTNQNHQLITMLEEESRQLEASK